MPLNKLQQAHRSIKTVLDALLKDLDYLHGELRIQASKYTKTDDYENAESLLAVLKAIDEFRPKVDIISQNSQICHDIEERLKAIRLKNPAQSLSSKKMYEFRRPILKSLVELGGKGQVKEVMALVEKKVCLTTADKKRDKTNLPIWYKPAYFCRLTLKHEGLLKDTSERGVWEISQAGRNWLNRKP